MKDQSGKDMVSKSKDKILTFQDTILNLQKFWSKKGCVVLQPYDMEVGAGTFHPATTLRSLGAKPWKTAYVQPSRRPTDGRYGDCLLYTSPSPRDQRGSRMPSSA